MSAEQFGGGEGGFPVAGRRHASAAHRDPFVADASQGTVGSPQEILDPLAFQRGHRPEHGAARQRPGEVGELLGQLGGGVDGHDPFGGQVGHPSGRGQVPVPHPTEHPVCQHHPGAQQPVVGGVQDGHVDAVAGGAPLHQPGDSDGVRQQGRGISLEGKVETHHRRSLETHGTYLPTRPGKTGATLEVTNWLGQNPSPSRLIRATSTRPQTSSPWFRHDRLAAAREDRLNQLQGRQSRLIRPASPWASCQTPVLWRLVYLVPVGVVVVLGVGIWWCCTSSPTRRWRRRCGVVERSSAGSRNVADRDALTQNRPKPPRQRLPGCRLQRWLGRCWPRTQRPEIAMHS